MSPNSITKSITVASVVFSFALSLTAQDSASNRFSKKNASWHDDINWSKGSVPSQRDRVIINLGNKVTVNEPVDEAISVGVGNGHTANPDGTLIINTDFKVTSLGLAGHPGSSGRVEQYGGIVTVKLLTLASTNPDSKEASYQLEGGKVETQDFKIGTMGAGIFSIKGTGEVVSIALKSEIGSQATLRFCGSTAGFPTMGFGTYSIEPGASLEVEGDKTTKPGKYALILADEPLAGRFNVSLLGFAAGKAKLLEGEPGVVLEVK